MANIKIVVDINMSESRKAEINAAIAEKRATVEEVLSVPYESIFKCFCPYWKYTWVDIMHEVIDMYFDKGSNVLWYDLYRQAARIARKRKTTTYKVLSDVIPNYLRSIFSISELRAFYKTKENVEKRIKREYTRHGRVDMADAFEVNISGRDNNEDMDLD